MNENTNMDESKCRPATDSAVTKSSNNKGRKRFWRSDIPDSELSETFCPVCGDQRKKFVFKDREYLVWKCKRCRHIYVSPPPSEAVLADYYTTSFMPQTEDENVYERGLFRIYDAAARAIAKSMPQRGVLLDVGSGFGGFLNRAAKDGWQLWGVEPNESAFVVCQRRLGEKVHLQKCSFEKADFAPSSFDGIVMLNVIEHVRDPLKICKYAFEILRPGGCLALRWPQRFYNRKLTPPAHLHSFTRRSMETLFRSTGFTEVREHWASTQDYRKYGFKKYLQATILRYAARIFFTCTLGKLQIPLVSRLTLGRKPKYAR